MGLFDIFSNSDAQNAAAAQTAGLNAGYSQLSDLFSQGRNALQTNYAAGLAPYTQNFNQAQQGTTQLGNLLGLNGPGGNASAQNTLNNLPGYQFALNQGAQNVNRNQAATGNLNSGATLNALQQQGQGQANQNYFNYAGQLQPYLGAAGNAASGIGGLYSGLGNQTNNSLMTQGNAAYGTQAGIGNANAQADYTQLAQSAGIFGSLTGLGSAALKAFGGGSLSDARAKDDIEPVGEMFDGSTVYRYRYKGDPRHQIGLIAQEVEEREPGAVIHNFAGRLKGVDYKRATDMAAELGKFLKAA